MTPKRPPSDLPTDLFAQLSALEEARYSGNVRLYADGEPRQLFIASAHYEHLVVLAREAGVRPEEYVERLIRAAVDTARR